MKNELTKMKERKAAAATSGGGGGAFIEVIDGKPFITGASHDADGNPNPPATAENFRRLAPQAAEQLRDQGAARRPATAGDAAAAASAERERITSILNCEHAAGREALARELALTPGMSAERAASILAAAPAEQPAFAIAPVPDDDTSASAEATVAVARNGGFIR